LSGGLHLPRGYVACFQYLKGYHHLNEVAFFDFAPLHHVSSRVVPFIEGVLDQEGVLSDSIGEAGVLKGLQIGTAAEAARSRYGNRVIWEIKVMREEALEEGP
jgi:hypothetical protein